MKVDLRCKNGHKVAADVESTGERVVEGARKQMHRSVERIVEEAKINTPVDTQNLEDSIRATPGYGTRGRLNFEITAGGGGLEQYAAIIHEHYEDIISDEEVDSKGRIRRLATIDKQTQHPDHYIGSKFLERALEGEREPLERNMVAAVQREIKQ